MSSRSSHPTFLLYFQKMLVNSRLETGQNLESGPVRAVLRDILIQGPPRTGSDIRLDGILAGRVAKRRPVSR
ncbi:hypothetical protein PMI07_003467 [Rhizobium sp. CF080]|nr:hypothetical protein PMI07_003467 [Rhizobium sp. CF080]